MMQTQLNEDDLLEELHPLAFAVKANNEDTPNYYQAMNVLDGNVYCYREEQDIALEEIKIYIPDTYLNLF
jgi:hypothetical protein